MSITTIMNYFQGIVTAYTPLQSFHFGEEELMSQQREITYPALLLMPPKKMFSGGLDATVRHYKIDLIIMQNVDIDDYEGRKTAWANTEIHTEQLIAKLCIDYQLEPDDFVADPVSAFTHDNLFGWQLSFELPIFSTLCIDEAQWQ